MIEKFIGWVFPQLQVLNWGRILIMAAAGVAVFFILKFVWVGRPEEFYNRGKSEGIAAQKLICAQEKKERDDEIQVQNDLLQKKRFAIAARPRDSAHTILKRMYLGQQ